MSKLADELFERLWDAGIESGVPEYSFAPFVDGKPVRSWKFDMAWPERRVAVEIDGGTFAGGRHTRGQGHAQDAHKRNVAQCMGWKVIVLTGRDKWRGRAARIVRCAFGDHEELGTVLMDGVKE